MRKQLLAIAYLLSAKVIPQSDKYRFLVQDTNFTLNFNSMGQFSLGEAIQQFLNQSRLKGSMQAFQIEEIWEKLMGKTISKYTEKIQIHGNRLYITTFVAPLKQELIYQKDTIMHRVNEALGEKIIKEVIIN